MVASLTPLNVCLASACWAFLVQVGFRMEGTSQPLPSYCAADPNQAFRSESPYSKGVASSLGTRGDVLAPHPLWVRAHPAGECCTSGKIARGGQLRFPLLTMMQCCTSAWSGDWSFQQAVRRCQSPLPQTSGFGSGVLVGTAVRQGWNSPSQKSGPFHALKRLGG